MGAGLYDNFRGTLGEESLIVTIFVVLLEFHNSRHSLSRRVELESEVSFWQVLLSVALKINVASADKLEHGQLGGSSIIKITDTVARY